MKAHDRKLKDDEDNIDESKLQNILTMIEKNEKGNESIPEAILQQANQLLSFDNKFYNVKNNIACYEEYSIIARKLHQRDHQFYGIVQCVQMLKNFLFVGNSQGIIRVFDLKTQKEMKPLMDKQYVGHDKVTTMDISGENGLLLAGYSDGSIVLWDLIDYKLLK